jgi:CubicO group peptidase (beta-lactamase class C family)
MPALIFGRTEVESEPPHKIARWDLRAIPRPAQFALPKMTEAELLEATNRRNNELARQQRFSGSVLIARHGKPLFTDACGMQDHCKRLDREHTNLVTTTKPGTPAGRGYGYGFGVSKEEGIRSFGDGGGAPGINSDLKIFPESGYVIVVMANLDPAAASRVSDFIAARLPVQEAKRTAETPSSP